MQKKKTLLNVVESYITYAINIIIYYTTKYRFSNAYVNITLKNIFSKSTNESELWNKKLRDIINHTIDCTNIYDLSLMYISVTIFFTYDAYFPFFMVCIISHQLPQILIINILNIRVMCTYEVHFSFWVLYVDCRRRTFTKFSCTYT